MRGGLNEADRHDRAHMVGRKSIETRSGLHQGGGRLADYYPPIFKAVSRLEPNTAETRGKIYDRARTAMLLQQSSDGHHRAWRRSPGRNAARVESCFWPGLKSAISRARCES